MYLYCTRSNKVFVFVFIFFRRYNWRAKHLFHCGLTPFAPPCLNLLLYRVLKARDFSCLRHSCQTGGGAGGIRRLLIYSLALSSSVREIPKSKEIWTLKSLYDWILTDKSTALQWKWLPNIKATRKTHNSHQGSSELHLNQCISLLFSFLCLFLYARLKNGTCYAVAMSVRPSVRPSAFSGLFFNMLWDINLKLGIYIQ